MRHECYYCAAILYKKKTITAKEFNSSVIVFLIKDKDFFSNMFCENLLKR